MKTLTFTMSQEDANLLINILNHPPSAQSIHLAGFINLFQQQAAPQIEEEKPAEESDNG